MTERVEQSSGGGTESDLLRGARIVCAVDSISEVPQWLEQAGACCIPFRGEGHARSAAAARELTNDAQGLVVDLDVGIALALDIARAAAPPCGVLFMADRIDAATCRSISRVHWGYRSKRASRMDVTFAMRRLVRLQMPDLARVAARAVRLWNLPPQQARILYYNLWSYPDQDIADALDVSIHTVQEYQDELRKKTGARSKQSYLARLLEVSGTKPPLPIARPPRSLRAPRSFAPSDARAALRKLAPRPCAITRSLEG